MRLQALIICLFPLCALAQTQPRANQVRSTASGNIASTNVQAALNELDGEKGSKRFNVVVKTSNYTPVASDTLKSGYLIMNSGSSTAFTIPANATTPFYIGTTFGFYNKGAGVCTITPENGSVIFESSQSVFTLATGQYAAVVKTATNTWQILIGDDLTASGTPGGADTQVQFNDAGAFNGEADFIYNKTTNTATVDNLAVDTEVYDATGWNGDLTVPTKDAVRDKIETLSAGSGITNSAGANILMMSDGTNAVTSGMTVGSSASSRWLQIPYTTVGGFAGYRFISGATTVFEHGVESSGQFGGSSGNLNGTSWYLYNAQTSRYSMGIGPDDSFFVGPSSAIFGFRADRLGTVTIGRTTSQSGELRIGEDNDNGTNYTGFTAPAALSADLQYTLPSAFPTIDNSRMTSTTAGVMTWQPTTLDVDAAATGNVTTGEDNIYSYTLPASTLAVNEQSLIIRVGGTLAGNGNSKTIKVKFGSTNIVNVTGTFTSTWAITCELIRTGAATQDCNCMTVGASSGLTHATITSPTETLSGTVAIVVTGEGTATNDIVRETATVRFEP